MTTTTEHNGIFSFYEENGYYFPLDAIPPDMAQKAAKRIIDWDQNPPALDHPWHLHAHLLADWVYDIAAHPAVLDAVEKILGPNILMQAADIFAKPPKGWKKINWHQDANYWGLEPFEVLTGWIALTDASVENGCMRFMAGTHKNHKIQHVETYAEDSALTLGQELNLEIDEEKSMPVILKAGQMSLHHCLTAHASAPNTTDAYRIGLAVRYFPCHVKQSDGPPQSAILVRGQDDYGHFNSDPIPKTSLGADEIAAHSVAMAPHAATKYSTA